MKQIPIFSETVVFTEGEETMTGEQALKYMRSRKSGSDQGTDLARGQRQQQVLEALVKRFQILIFCSMNQKKSVSSIAFI